MGTRLAKISGTLQELSGEELARQQGLPAAPPTPLATQGMGASQDVAKMAGTPNQVRSMIQGTLDERQRTRDLLGESERTGARRRFTVDSLQERMNTLEGLGSLSNRVPEYIRTQLKTAETVAVPNTVNADAVTAHLSSLGITNPAAVTAATAALDKVRLGTANPADITAALEALKIDATITDSTTSLAEKFSKFYNEAGVEDIKKQMASVLQNYSDVKMKELPEVLAEYANQANDVADIPALLGLTDEAFGELTLGQVQAQLKAWKNRNFQDVDALRDVLADPTYSISEKDYARERLAELGAIGVTSIEQKTNNLEAQVAEGDSVVVGGVRVKVAELMSNPKLKSIIATALDSPEELKKLETTDADLAKWISNNQNSLKKVRNELLSGTQEFADNQKVFSNKLGNSATLHKTFLDSVIPGWNKAKDIKWDEWVGKPAEGDQPASGLYATSPTIAYTLSMTDETKRNYALSALSKLTPEQAKTFSTTFLDQIANTATTEVEAQQFITAYLDTENKDWQSGITVDTVSVPRDADFTDADYTAAVNKALQEFAPEFKTLDDLVAKINQLRVGGPKDRIEAKRLSGILANVKGELQKSLRSENIEKIKAENKTKRQQKVFDDASMETETLYKSVTNALRGRGEDYLRARGLTVFLNINSEMKSIPSKVKEKIISYEEGLKQISALKERMSGELAAFLFDDNHRNKNPEAALDAMQILKDSKLSGSLSNANRNGIRKRLEAMQDTYTRLASNTNNRDARARFLALAQRASNLFIEF